MKGLIPVAMSVAMVAATGCRTQSELAAGLEVKAMTFNIRCGTAKDGDNSWGNRHRQAAAVIRQYGPDVVGLQEAYRFQIDTLRMALPEYGEIGEGRDGGMRGEYSAILYRIARFTVEDSGTFWLSETPEKVSRSWGSACVRICTWAHLRDRETGLAFYLYNTHLDHRSEAAREGGVKVIANAIEQRKEKDPFLLMGDFNAGESSPPLAYLEAGETSPVHLVDTFRVLYPDETSVGTYHGFRGGTSGTKIDYILVPAGVQTLAADIVQEKLDGRYPSDHFPVTATIRLPGSAEGQ
jgi:endonuclease/exonuclease/phosphatase family metal-dependent hydrolase